MRYVTLSMAEAERETFLADLHVGVINIARKDRGTLTVPMWYVFEPSGKIAIVTERGSRKGRLLQEAGTTSSSRCNLNVGSRLTAPN